MATTCQSPPLVLLQEWSEYDEKGEEALTLMGLRAEFRLHK
jgi:hypothetical protein